MFDTSYTALRRRGTRRLPLALGPLITLVWFATAATASPDYVGVDRCAQCHQREAELWRGSHHDLAMTDATEQTVLGDFDNAEFSAQGVSSRFYRKDDDFLVRTDGPDGRLHDYKIRYTFGWYPLQQYLIEFPGGRLQTLAFSWDTRSAADGGQRWFHIYPDEYIAPDDSLHWTGLQQNWNYMCAECHSTNVIMGYDADSDSFDTTWSEISVGCEGCHGPGSTHARLAESGAEGAAAARARGPELQGFGVSEEDYAAYRRARRARRDVDRAAARLAARGPRPRPGRATARW